MKSLADLVDLDHSSVSRELFVNAELYQQELEQVFARSWLFVGHESQLPNPGDYFLSQMGEESVIVNRDMSGKIHVFLNTCTHRGMRLCRYDEGNSDSFACPYHGWTFGADGTLAAVPQFKQAYHEELDRPSLGLIEPPKLTIYRGTIWANWSSGAADFLESLGGARYYLEAFLTAPDGSDTPLEAIVGIQKWRIPCNWKLAAENFAGDYYHGVSHASVDQVSISPSGKPGRHQFDAVKTRPVLQNISFPHTGHSARGALFTEQTLTYQELYAELPEVNEWFRKAHVARVKRLGDEARLMHHGGTLFPNFSFSNGRMSIAVWHPNGPTETLAWRWYLVPTDAPEIVKTVLRQYAMRYQGPAGMTEQDDMENWNQASAASLGTIARRHAYNYGMGKGHELTAGRYPWIAQGGLVTEGVSEQNQRGFYQYWARQMVAGPL